MSILVLLVLVLSACARPAEPPASVALPQHAAGPREPGPSPLDDPYAPGLPAPSINPVELRPGGPPPDGIPAVDSPRFLRPRHVRWLEDDEPVLSLEIAGDARAYPVQIMVWHEIVNDTVGGVPVAVTYCPLCNTAVAYDRRAAGRVLDFGTSGLLHNSDLVMYDRQTRSLWVQLLGSAVAGRLTGTELVRHAVQLLSWRQWRSAHGDGWVLSRETGARRDYGRNPYPGYDRIDSPAFLFEGRVDGRLAAKERVVGLRRERDAIAVVLDHLRARRAVEVRLDGTPVVVLFTPGTASALDAPTVAGGRDVGATGAFEAELDGVHLRFRPDGDLFRDTTTGTTWDVLGRAVAGPRRGERLRSVAAVDTFWFAWAAFLPDTRVVGG